MANFNWQTTDDDSWEELVPPTPEPTPPTSNRRNWLGVALLLLLITIAIGIVYRQSQVGQATIETEAKESIAYIQETIQGRDGELIYPLLSGRSPSWAEQQKKRVSEGTFFDRPSFGLTYIAPHSDSNMVLSADLQEAIVTTEQRYQGTLANGEDVETVFQETAVYRLGNARWLLAPPLSEFWGEQQTHEGALINLTYPARDAEWAVPIAKQLDSTLIRLCQQPSMVCPSTIRVQFSDSNGAIESMEDTFTSTPLDPVLPLTLPTPTLVGLPTDEVGLQLLTEGYGRQIATAVLHTAINNTCCKNNPFYRSLIRYQLSTLDLLVWQVHPDNFNRFLTENMMLANLASPISWNSKQDNPDYDWAVDMAVEFIMNNLDDSYDPISALRQMDQTDNLFLWVAQITPLTNNRFDSKILEDSFGLYIHTEAQARQATERPFDLPDQQLQLICQPNIPDPISSQYPHMQLYRHDPQTVDSHIIADFGESYPIISPLPNQSGSLVQNIKDEGAIETFLLQNQESSLLPLESDTSFITFGQIFPNTQKLLVYQYTQTSNTTQPHLLDLNSCQQGDCTFEEMADLLIWSPNGRYGIFGQQDTFYDLFYVEQRVFSLSISAEPVPENAPLEIRSISGTTINTTASMPIGEGHSPFWLDNETFGYIRDLDPSQGNLNPRQAGIFLGTSLGTEPELIITADELHDQLPPELQSQKWVLRPLYAMPVSDEEAILVINNPNSLHMYLFRWTRADNSFEFMFDIHSFGTHALSLSPNGRWFAMNGITDDDSRRSDIRHFVRVYDWQNNTYQDLPFTGNLFFPDYSFDWSADSQWLALNGRFNALTLYAPETDYYELQTHSLGSCGSILWVENE